MLIAIEGIDGSGKQTQAKRLVERISAEWKHTPVLFSFPDYDGSDLGPKIRHYLKGWFGKLYDNHPFLVSLLFAVERYEKYHEIEDALSRGNVVVCDRYSPSNLAYQAGKLYDNTLEPKSEWLKVLYDIEHVEYDILGMRRPDLVFYLDLAAEQSWERTRSRDSGAADIHQDNKIYLQNVRQVYKYLAQAPSWRTIACFNADGTPRTIEDIHAEIFAALLSWKETCECG